ncbi:unnamed protein product [Symbiodinium natans]|uniref:Protein kinase domain-containing protein n=1 Tax=Symbiodinium natans TaxID=878477 RepID=A0A812N011_9DINO|nr:unnamed protein product [Symbiodinium natans]
MTWICGDLRCRARPRKRAKGEADLGKKHVHLPFYSEYCTRLYDKLQAEFMARLFTGFGHRYAAELFDKLEPNFCSQLFSVLGSAFASRLLRQLGDDFVADLFLSLGTPFVGTLFHELGACPEVLRQEAHGTAADLFSFGAVIWTLLSGGNDAQERPQPVVHDWLAPPSFSNPRRCLEVAEENPIVHVRMVILFFVAFSLLHVRFDVPGHSVDQIVHLRTYCYFSWCSDRFVFVSMSLAIVD